MRVLAGRRQSIFHFVIRQEMAEDSLCMRVLTMSSGCTIKVAMVPAESPATVSTRAGERPASLSFVIETDVGWQPATL